MLSYALLGTSRVLSVSSTATLAILAATQLGLVVPDGDPGKLITAVATLSALTGALLLLIAALRRMPQVSCRALAGSLRSQVAGVWSGMGAWGKDMAAEIQLHEYPPAPAASPPAVRRVVAVAHTTRMPDIKAGQSFGMDR